MTSRKKSDICGLFFGSDVFAINSLKATRDDIIKVVVMHSARLTKNFYVIKT